MLVDLHTHSTASDGTLAPEALARRAIGNGVQMLALTDHDSVAGVRMLQARAADFPGLDLVPGVELSTALGDQPLHVVGLWLDIDHARLGELLHGQRIRREARGRLIGERLARAGFAGCYEGARALADTAQLSRPHFARYLVQAGHCPDENRAFRRWLGRGRPGDVAVDWPPLAEAVDAILSAGGMAVLAHPLKYRLTRRKLDAVLGAFAAAGGQALELVSGAQPAAAAGDLLRLGKKHRLAASTGSDFHSPAQVWCDVGGQPALPEGAAPVWPMRAA